jgi:hypothetical protein
MLEKVITTGLSLLVALESTLPHRGFNSYLQPLIIACSAYIEKSHNIFI